MFRIDNTNRTDIEEDLAHLRRDMRWDLYFQKREEQRQEEGGEEEDGEEREREKRVLKDRKLKTNLPTRWSIPKALADFEAGVEYAATSGQGIRHI